MGNGKREFVPRDQVFRILIAYCSLSQIGRFMPILSITNALSCFYPLISHFGNFSTLISRLLFAVNAMVSLSNRHSIAHEVSLVQITGASAAVKDWTVACVAVSVFAVILTLFCTLKRRKRARKGHYNCKFVIELDLKGIFSFKNQLIFAKNSGTVTREKTDNLSGALARQARAAEHHG